MADPCRTARSDDHPAVSAKGMVGSQVVEFADGTLGYLNAISWSLNSLAYERGGRSVLLFPEVKPWCQDVIALRMPWCHNALKSGPGEIQGPLFRAAARHGSMVEC